MTLQETLSPFINKTWHYSMTVSCPKGWEALVLDTHSKLVEMDPEYRIDQIKEKFGGLRYYATTKLTDEAREAFYKIVYTAEGKSFEICDNCGTEENVSTKVLGEGFYWILTLCDFCRLQQHAEAVERKERIDREYDLDSDEDE